MLVVLAERLAQIIEWFKSSAGYSKLNWIKINKFDQQNKNVRHGKDLYNIYAMQFLFFKELWNQIGKY